MAKVLVVDDERDVVELIKFLLERDNHKVVEAYNGREALERAFAELPDLIILDINLPGMDGYVPKPIRRSALFTAIAGVLPAERLVQGLHPPK